MAVTEQTPLNSYTANGVTTVFAFPFLVLLAADLVVQVTNTGGVTTTKALGVDYTIAGLGVASGGTVTFLAAPANGYKVVVYRNSAIARATDYQDNGDLLARTVNFDFDRLWLVLQEIFNGGKGAPTALRVPNGETVSTLGNAAARAGNLLGFDSNGNPIVVVPGPSGTATALALDLASSNNAAKGAGQLGYSQALAYAAGTVGAKLHEIVSVKDFGAVGDGVTDDRAAFQAAITACIAANKTLYVPNGTYLMASYPVVATLPRDDGTVYPPWVGAGDANIAAEAASTSNFALAIPSGLRIVGESRDGTIIKGQWDVAASAVAVGNNGCFFIGTSHDAQLAGTGILAISDITIQQFMIGGYAIGGLLYAQIDRVNFGYMAFPWLVQNSDLNARYSSLRVYGCYCGLVFGGWWLMRSRTSFETAYMPPYPATDVWRTGWCDSTIVDGIEFTANPAVDARWTSIDTFFDTYFFKNANSTLTSGGGRASNNASPSFVLLAPWRGVAGRAVTFYSRYGRIAQRNGVRNYAGNKNPRSAVYLTRGVQFLADNFYVEKAGYENPSLVTAYLDPRNGGAQSPAHAVWNEIGNNGVTSGFASNIQVTDSVAATPPYLGMAGSPITQGANNQFTPVLAGVTTPGTYTYASQLGRFTRVGDRVFFTIQLGLSGITVAATGNMKITGLPIAAAAGGPISAVHIATFDALNLSVGYTFAGGWIAAGSNEILLFESGDNVGRQNLQPAQFATTTLLVLSGHYEV